MQKKLFYLCVLITVFLYFSFPNLNVEGNTKEIDISTSPHNVFFEIKNSKPGDTFTKVLNVQNNGSQDFQYLFSNEFLTGSDKLFNELVLTISDKKGELYTGKLKDFKKLNSRLLKVNTSEDLTLSVYFPYELGNEFQNLNSEFEFKFYVKGTLGGLLPVDGPKLPNTASDMFNIIGIGVVLVMVGGAYYLVGKRKKTDLFR